MIWLNHMTVLFLLFWRNFTQFSIVVAASYTPTNSVQDLFFSTSLSTLVIFDDGYSDRCEVIAHCSLELHLSDYPLYWNVNHLYVFPPLWSHYAACEILAPQPEKEPVPPVMEVQNPNHRTPREFHLQVFLRKMPIQVLCQILNHVIFASSSMSSLYILGINPYQTYTLQTSLVR